MVLNRTPYVPFWKTLLIAVRRGVLTTVFVDAATTLSQGIKVLFADGYCHKNLSMIDYTSMVSFDLPPAVTS